MQHSCTMIRVFLISMVSIQDKMDLCWKWTGLSITTIVMAQADRLFHGHVESQPDRTGRRVLCRHCKSCNKDRLRSGTSSGCSASWIWMWTTQHTQRHKVPSWPWPAPPPSTTSRRSSPTSTSTAHRLKIPGCRTGTWTGISANCLVPIMQHTGEKYCSVCTVCVWRCVCVFV